MNRKIVVRLFLFCFIVLLVTFVAFSLWDFSGEMEKERVDIINAIRLKQIQLEKLADRMSRCADTSYYGVFQHKARKFDIHHLKNDSIDWDSPWQNNSDCLMDVLITAREVEVQKLWNSKTDSFYRFEFYLGTYWIPMVYIPKQQIDTAQPVKGAAGMYKISQRVYLKLTKDPDWD